MSRSGRNLTAEYRRNRLRVLARSDLCWLCGHGGAKTADHVIPPKYWPLGQPGVDAVANLRPAHGTLGNRMSNPCPTCGKLCNQARGNRLPTTSRPQTRDWYSGD